MKPEDYGSQYQEHLLEEYKLYVEMADRVSHRRSSLRLRGKLRGKLRGNCITLPGESAGAKRPPRQVNAAILIIWPGRLALVDCIA